MTEAFNNLGRIYLFQHVFKQKKTEIITQNGGTRRLTRYLPLIFSSKKHVSKRQFKTHIFDKSMLSNKDSNLIFSCLIKVWSYVGVFSSKCLFYADLQNVSTITTRGCVKLSGLQENEGQT